MIGDVMGLNDILYALFVSQDNTQVERYQGTEIIKCLSETSADQVLDILRHNQENLIPVKTGNIPQFSNINDIFRVIQVLIDSPEPTITRETIGYYLCPAGSKSGAMTKYGENHLKIATQLGLIDNADNMQVTDLGLSLYLVNDMSKRMHLLGMLSLRVPIIQYALLQAIEERFNIFNYLLTYLSYSTALRRRSNIRVLLRLVDGISTPELRRILFNIVWEDNEDKDNEF